MTITCKKKAIGKAFSYAKRTSKVTQKVKNMMFFFAFCSIKYNNSRFSIDCQVSKYISGSFSSNQ